MTGKGDTIHSIGFVSTYPPTSCGLATFTTSLRKAIMQERRSGDGLDVVSLVDVPTDTPGPGVVHQLVAGDRDSLSAAAELLNTHDVALLQHEYGIYGGRDGVEILDLISLLQVPTVVTLHTVLAKPSPNQRVILEKIVDQTDESIVMSHVALGHIKAAYSIDENKVRFIPHGAASSLAGPRVAGGERPIVLTWGLLGRGKGLETAIEAFGYLKDLRPLPRFIILGKTHPKVWAAEGDAYLLELMHRVESLGLGGVVEFDPRYLDVEALSLEVRKSGMVLLPYESTEQVTSGVLVEAITAGRPVVATAFPHAVEMLGTGAGIVVPHADPAAMAGAIRSLLTDSTLANKAAAVARSVGASLQWPAVAAQYDAIVSRLAEHFGQPEDRGLPLLGRFAIDEVGKVG
jgi:glycosyltransferase involved in cell wall biosynthesis